MLKNNEIKIILAGGAALYFKEMHVFIPDIKTYDNIFEKYRTELVPANLLKAVAIVESSLDHKAVNRNDPSFGLMQILYTGSNKLYVDGWDDVSIEKLMKPDFNVHIGSQILNWNIAKYGRKRGIICYNNWSAREGLIPYKSMKYYVKVLSVYARLG